MSCSRNEMHIWQNQFQIEDDGENHCGVLWKVMPSAKYVAISKLSETELKVRMTKI